MLRVPFLGHGIIVTFTLNGRVVTDKTWLALWLARRPFLCHRQQHTAIAYYSLLYWLATEIYLTDVLKIREKKCKNANNSDVYCNIRILIS